MHIGLAASFNAPPLRKKCAYLLYPVVIKMSVTTVILVVAAIALALLVADRYLRINQYLALEGFMSGGGSQRCGVDLEPCPHPLKCMNSFCADTVQPPLHDRNPLPVVP